MYIIAYVHVVKDIHWAVMIFISVQTVKTKEEKEVLENFATTVSPGLV